MRFSLLLVLPFLLLSAFNSNCQLIAPLPPGFSAPVLALEFDTVTHTLYASGIFNALGDSLQTPMRRIASWNGTTWDSLGSGADAFVTELIMYNSDLIVAGDFENIGGISAERIARWDGTNWFNFGNVTNLLTINSVNSLFVNGNDLYVGGEFDTMGGIAAQGIARYDGLNWHNYPPINSSFFDVRAITIFNNELYIGGNFYAGQGLIDIMKFDGNSWVTVGGGLGSGFTEINCFSVFQNNLYVGGSGGSPGDNIAIWDGQNWSQPGVGLQASFIGEFYCYSGKLYTIGTINSVNGLPTSNIAVWDGISWSDFYGFTFNNAVRDIVAGDNIMYIGGHFMYFGNDPILCIAQMNLTNGISENFDDCYDFIQTNYNLVISSQGCEKMDRYAVYDITGRIIYVCNNGDEDKINVDISYLKSGIYFVRVENKHHNFSRKFVKL